VTPAEHHVKLAAGLMVTYDDDSNANENWDETCWSYNQYSDTMDNDYQFSQPSNMAMLEIYSHIFLATDMQQGHDIRDTQTVPVLVLNSSIHSSIVCASPWMCMNNMVFSHCFNLYQPGVPRAGWTYNWTTKYHFIYLGNNDTYCIFKKCCTISILFPTKCCIFHNFNCFDSYNIHISHTCVLKFKCPPPPPPTPPNSPSC
jgi:hypothetical protein